tara:strand:+ start:3617 stop:4180 length:564 start_codon:yes stop_codon:yes gene_type:complete
MIFKRLAILAGVIFLVASCYQYKKPEKPKNLISKDKMVDILIDVKLIASANAINKKIMENNGLNPETYVFTKHNIDSLQFALSNDYYAFYSKEYEEIYTKVIDSLDELKGIYKALELKEEEAAEAKRKQDSINRINNKDSLGFIKMKDSLKVKMEKDSLTETLLKKKFEDDRGELIAPVSDTGSQSQ